MASKPPSQIENEAKNREKLIQQVSKEMESTKKIETSEASSAISQAARHLEAMN